MDIYAVIVPILILFVILFIKLYTKNSTHLEQKELEVIQMKVKVKPIDKTDGVSFGNAESGSFGKPEVSKKGFDSSSSKNKNPIYVTFNSSKIIKSKYLNYVGLSAKTGSAIYMLNGDDISILKGTGYQEILNLTSNMILGKSDGFKKTF